MSAPSASPLVTSALTAPCCFEIASGTPSPVALALSWYSTNPRSKILDAPGTEVRQLETSPAVHVSAVAIRISLALARSSAAAACSSNSEENIASLDLLFPNGPQPLDGTQRARLDILYVETDVHGSDAVRKVAHRDHINAGLGDRDDGLLVDAAGSFS